MRFVPRGSRSALNGGAAAAADALAACPRINGTSVPLEHLDLFPGIKRPGDASRARLREAMLHTEQHNVNLKHHDQPKTKLPVKELLKSNMACTKWDCHVGRRNQVSAQCCTGDIRGEGDTVLSTQGGQTDVLVEWLNPRVFFPMNYFLGRHIEGPLGKGNIDHGSCVVAAMTFFDSLEANA